LKVSPGFSPRLIRGAIQSHQGRKIIEESYSKPRERKNEGIEMKKLNQDRKREENRGKKEEKMDRRTRPVRVGQAEKGGNSRGEL
jgi:hypothetical protein